MGQAFEWDESLLLYGITPRAGSSRSYTIANTDGTVTVVRGTGFTYDAQGKPTGGTITRIDHLDLRDETPVLLERITNVSSSLGTLAALVSGYTTARDQIGWFDFITQTETSPEASEEPTDTSIRFENSDGTFTEIVGTGFLAALGNALIGGTVTAIRRLDAGGNPIPGESIAQANITLATALAIISDNFLSETVFRTGIMAGGATYTVFAHADDYDNLGTDLGISGGAGNDHFVGLAGGGTMLDYSGAAAAITANMVAGTAVGDGNDTFVDVRGIRGSQFDDSLTGDGNSNIFEGNNGNDTLIGGGGNDSLQGGMGDDVLSGGAGIDTADYWLFGDGSAITVDLRITTQQNTGGAGLDTLTSIENVMGSDFGDALTGSSLRNELSGMGGNDSINGLGGDDTLIGGAGNDTLRGSTGNDKFVFNAAYGASNVDRVMDFAAGDKLLFDVSIFDQLSYSGPGGGAEESLLASQFTTLALGVGQDHRLIYDEATKKLYYDINGSDAGGRTLVAVLVGTSTLSATDFIVYTDQVLA